MTRVLVVSLALAVPLVAHADNWPQWRGPNNDGISKEVGLPTKWSATEVSWKLPLPGMAGSTPVVWGDRIFLTSEAGTDLVLICASTEGRELWRKTLGSGGRRHRTDEGCDASPSPTVDGTHVFAFVGPGDLACFTFDGTEVWRFDPQKRYGRFNIQFGMQSTPVLHGGRLYLQLFHSAGQWVVAVDKATGNPVWKIDRKSDGRAECEHSYASPMVWSNGKDAYLLVHGNDYTTAHQFDDGSEIWRLGGLNPQERYNPTLRFVSSPLATPNLIVVPTAKSGTTVAVKPTATGTFAAGSEHEAWRVPKITPDVPSPLLHDGLVYLCRETGYLVCLEAATGKELYNQRIHTAKHRASPVLGDGKIYTTARDGTICVVRAGSKFELLATNKMGDDIASSPAIANGRIYLRGYKALYAIGK